MSKESKENKWEKDPLIPEHEIKRGEDGFIIDRRISEKPKTGTKEWSEHSCNIQTGCERGCRYCYAKYNAVHRFTLCSAEQWKDPVISRRRVDGNYAKKKGVIMFPTTHGVTDRNISEYMCVLHKLLSAGNTVLAVMKPQWNIVPMMCETLRKMYPKPQLLKSFMFRFTIGSTNNTVLEFWEPGAKKFEERLSCLLYAYNAGFNTSVSCEPYLDAYPDHVYEACIEYITDSFWVGMLRNFEKRVVLDTVTEMQMAQFVKPLKKLQDETIVKAMYNKMKDYPMIRWKDSVRMIIDNGHRRRKNTGTGGRNGSLFQGAREKTDSAD